ncbi:peptidase M50 [Candidatus Oscillochloris fontis]|uniref:peptidase M50 n=1 Tax=Candidatus Oscillochloris fontis TaxID=2496868 RepID=UPI00101E2189|nr:peptidase M50 [Candidatus Oscillochloris fontis]
MRDIFSTPSDDGFPRGTDDNLELLKAWGGSTLAYAIFQTGADRLFSATFIQNLVIAAIVCGLAFVLHELAHRVVARSYGAEAHFIANNQWLLISIAISLAGIFIAAPGAVWHRGHLTLKQSGLIALAGPVTNLVLSIFFLLLLCLLVLVGIPLPMFVLITLIIGFKFNAWLGLFNMIPAGPFDGTKVLAWNWQVFAVTVTVGLFLAFVLNERMVINLLVSLRGM